MFDFSNFIGVNVRIVVFLLLVRGKSYMDILPCVSPIFFKINIVIINKICRHVQPLRSAIASTFYGDLGIEEDDIFVSDGAKCDISRFQVCLISTSNILKLVKYVISQLFQKFCLNYLFLF